MDIFAMYIAMFLVVFLIVPVTYYSLRFLLWFILEYCECSNAYLRDQYRSRMHGEQSGRSIGAHWGLFYDRQGNIFTISDETTGNTVGNRYPDFFYLEPSADEAARIRAQLEKDDKDLPSYDDVMRMSSVLSTPAAATLAVPTTRNDTTTNDDSDLGPPPSPPDTSVLVPPYSEIDPNSATTSNNTASTSRGASVTIPIGSSSSNTSV